MECSDEDYEALLYVMDALEAGDHDSIPIGRSYLIENGYSILTTTGAWMIVAFPEDEDVYNILLAGDLTTPPDIVDL